MPRDTDLVLRDGTSNLTTTETLTKTLRGGNSHINPLGVFILVPGAPSAETLTWRVRFTDSGKQHSIIPTTVHTAGTDTVPETYSVPLPYTDAESLEILLTVSASGNWGAVQVWLDRADKAKTPDAA